MNDEGIAYRREHIRFKLHVPLYAELTLQRVGGREMNSRTQKVLLDDISFGGCLFRTHLQLPVREDVEWRMMLPLGSFVIRATTVVVRAYEEEGYFLHGARWVQSDYEKHLFQYRLNRYLQAAYAFGPHIQTLYRKVNERGDDGRFKRLDLGK